MNKEQQEILDNAVLGVSPLSGKVYIGLIDKDNPNEWKIKSDFYR